MEASQSDAATDGPQEVEQKLHTSIKPIHRFIKGEPKSLGIVILLLGCAEFLMGFLLMNNDLSSTEALIPFWQGFLFIICGSLSIYTEIHPSKKMVTVCLAMYIPTILAIIISFCMRLGFISRMRYHSFYFYENQGYNWLITMAVESVMTSWALCVAGFLIALSTVARLGLKSTGTQFIIQHVQPGQSVIASS